VKPFDPFWLDRDEDGNIHPPTRVYIGPSILDTEISDEEHEAFARETAAEFAKLGLDYADCLKRYAYEPD